jgi:hypothetical protein
MKTTFGPPTLRVCECRPGTWFEAYRIVRSDAREDPALLNCFRSNFDLCREPRRAERSSAVIHMGISMYMTPSAAIETAQAFPKLGSYVAFLRLEHGHGFNWARTGPDCHLTIWGDPVKLVEAVVDIRPVVL